MLARNGMARRLLGRCCAWVTVILLPLSIFFERNRRRPFQPAARAIRHKFDEVNAIFMNGRQATVGLPHVDTRIDPVNNLVGSPPQSATPPAPAHRHAEARTCRER